MFWSILHRTIFWELTKVFLLSLLGITGILLNVYAMRMAAVFTLTTVTIARRTAIVSRWLTVAGLVSALVLFVGVGLSPWAELVFPAWILALSIDILTAGLGARSARVQPISTTEL